uniref:Uncharacterized protein n=1 Tax=Neogobius melanostomus TaxID=47308 RepID=A0A8C6U3K6_9GOBI
MVLKDIKKNKSTMAVKCIGINSIALFIFSSLQSGSSVHLQLLHVEPGLSEIGSDQVENQTFIREQKQLLEKLKVCTGPWRAL